MTKPTDMSPEELKELHSLFRQRLKEGLEQPNPRASFLAVVAKYLSENPDAAKPGTPLADAAARVLPFPKDDRPRREMLFSGPEFAAPKLK